MIVCRAGIVFVGVLVAGGACSSTHNAPTRVAATEPDQPSPSIPVAAVPPTSRWEVDPENSSVGFVCMHVLTKVRGMFSRPSGSVLLDEANPANTNINAAIDVNSISTGIEERDTHLKSPDFFDIAKYPAITFASTSVSRASATSYSVSGDLTMHGVTKPITLSVTATPPFHHAGGIRRGIEATMSVNRKDFGLVWEFPGEGAGIVVGDNIQITINAELVLQPDASKGG